MSFQSFLYNLNNPINLRNSQSTNLIQLWYILITLWNTSSNNNRFLNFLSLTHHTQERILRRILNRTTINKNKISLLWIIHNIISIIRKLPNHELTIGYVMWTSKCFYIDVMCSWYFLFCLDEEIDFCIVDLLLFLLLLLCFVFLTDFVTFLLFFQ